MFRINFRDQQRHQRIHPVIPRIAQHHVPGRRKIRFRLSRNRRIQRRKNQLWSHSRLQLFHRQLRRRSRNRRRQSPRQISVAFARRTLARRQPRSLEPRMSFEQRNKLLPDRPRRSQNPYLNFGLGMHVFSWAQHCCPFFDFTGHLPPPPSPNSVPVPVAQDLPAGPPPGPSNSRSPATAESKYPPTPTAPALPPESKHASSSPDGTVATSLR